MRAWVLAALLATGCGGVPDLGGPYGFCGTDALDCGEGKHCLRGILEGDHWVCVGPCRDDSACCLDTSSGAVDVPAEYCSTCEECY